MGFYDNKLRALLADPSSIKADPSYQFGLDSALQAVNRSNSRQRGSGNALVDLLKTGEGYAASRYGENVDRLGRLSGQEMQGELGTRAANNADEMTRLTGLRDAGSLELGREGNRLTGVRDDHAFDLGQRADALGNFRAVNDLDLGREGLATSRERNWWDHSDAQDRLGLDRSTAENGWNLNRDKLGLDWYDAKTRRGAAESTDYYAGRRAAAGGY